VLGFALSRYVWVSDQPGGDQCHSDHIARIAYERAGGSEPIWFGFDLEPGRGMGFSAAARAAGATLAYLQAGLALEESQRRAYEVVTELEGHGDNAAPAVFGGLHVVVDNQNQRLAANIPGEVLCWVPEWSTATDKSRIQLASTIDRADAIFNLGRVGLLIAACYEQRLDWLGQATQDRLHQPPRLAQAPQLSQVIERALAAGADAAWLSGSGPTIAIVATAERRDAIAAALPADGKTLHLEVDQTGAVPVSEGATETQSAEALAD